MEWYLEQYVNVQIERVKSCEYLGSLIEPGGYGTKEIKRRWRWHSNKCIIRNFILLCVALHSFSM